MKASINRLSRMTRNRNLGLFLIRLGTGLVFLMHGWMKVNNLSGVEGMFMHFGLGGPTGIFIAYLEVIGGLCLILGIFTRIFGTAFGIEMLVATFIMGVPTSYQPHEMEIFLMLMSFGIALAGSGAYSLWKMECDLCGGALCRADMDCPGK
jgi:putative oxidoreductase